MRTQAYSHYERISLFLICTHLQFLGIHAHDLTLEDLAAIKDTIQARLDKLGVAMHIALGVMEGCCMLTYRLVAESHVSADDLVELEGVLDGVEDLLPARLRAKMERMLVQSDSDSSRPTHAESGASASSANASTVVMSLPSLAPAATAYAEGRGVVAAASVSLTLPVPPVSGVDASEWEVSVYSHARRVELPVASSSFLDADLVHVEIESSTAMVSPDVLEIALKRTAASVASLPSTATHALVHVPVCSVLVVPSASVREEMATKLGADKDSPVSVRSCVIVGGKGGRGLEY